MSTCICVHVCLPVCLDINEMSNWGSHLKRYLLYCGDVKETILARKRHVSARQLRKLHTQIVPYTHIQYRIIQILIVPCEKAGAAPLPLQYVISSAICMLWAVRDSGVRTAQEEHGCPSSFTLKLLLWPIHRLFSLLLCSFSLENALSD